MIIMIIFYLHGYIRIQLYTAKSFIYLGLLVQIWSPFCIYWAAGPSQILDESQLPVQIILLIKHRRNILNYFIQTLRKCHFTSLQNDSYVIIDMVQTNKSIVVLVGHLLQCHNNIQFIHMSSTCRGSVWMVLQSRRLVEI